MLFPLSAATPARRKRTISEVDSDDGVFDTPAASGHEFKITNYSFDDAVDIHRPNVMLAQATTDVQGAAFRNVALKEYLELQQRSPNISRSAWLSTAVKKGKRPGEAVVTLYPAEASGASSDPKLQLMGIPREIRDKIFRSAVLAEQDVQMYLWKQIKGDSFTSLSSKNCALEQTCVYGCIFAQDFLNGDGSDPRGLFLVCKQAYEESRALFYGCNRFQFADATTNWSTPIFQELHGEPRGGLSASNASLIKNIVIDMESLVLARTESRSLIEPLVLVLCRWLPGLQSLTLSREINKRERSWRLMRERNPDSTFTAEDIAFTLRIASRMALNHPVLTKIVWEAGTDRVWFPGQQIDGRLIYPETLGSGLYVKVVPATYDTTVPTTRVDAKGRELSITNITLDREKILQTAWKNLGKQQVSHYAVPGNEDAIMQMLVDATANEKFRI